jgi:AraC-like DNA-binding protein
MVAQAFGISVRHLNRVLREDGSATAERIRRQRMERCRRDLADPAHAADPVAAIGARWGFADPATFNRAFRNTFGVPPGEYRRWWRSEATP